MAGGIYASPIFWSVPSIVYMSASSGLVAVNPSGSSAARTFPVKVRLNDPDGKLKPGMSVTARVPMGQRVDVLTVPSDAVHQSAAGAVIWVEVNGAAMPVAVKVLFSEGDRYAVKPIQTDGGPGGAGLSPQTRVVIEGAERLFPGRPLKLIEPGDSP